MEIYNKLPNVLQHIIDRMVHEINFAEVLNDYITELPECTICKIYFTHGYQQAYNDKDVINLFEYICDDCVEKSEYKNSIKHYQEPVNENYLIDNILSSTNSKYKSYSSYYDKFFKNYNILINYDEFFKNFNIIN